MIPDEREKKMFKMSNFLPSDLLNEEEQPMNSNEASPDEKYNFILEEEDSNNEEAFIPHFDSNDTNGPVFPNPKTHYSDSHILESYRSQMQMSNNLYLCNRNFYHGGVQYNQQPQSYCTMPLFNNSPRFFPYANNINMLPQPFQYQNQMYLQGKMPQSLSQLNMSMGMPSLMNYNSNGSKKAFSNNTSTSETEEQQFCNPSVHQMRKYNSSGNIKNEYLMNSPQAQPQGKTSKGSNKRKKSSLFLNKSENKAECDIRDFKRFCDGLKCDLDKYICSQIGSR